MKLVIMIPCLNEEKTLPLVLNTIPKKIPGIDDIEILLIDDGSTDKTVEVAKSHGVKQFLYHVKNQGLSRSFRHGLNRSLELGADIIVLTEGDNQYKQERIPDLIRPILENQADLVIADRQTQTVAHFSPAKKFFQKFGTWVLNVAAGTNVPDALSGFRAYSRKAAVQLNPVADYSWATETTIQASHKHQAIVIIPIKTNPKLRESRQFKSSWQHIRKSSITIMRAFIMYRPYAVFLSLGSFFLILGAIPFVRYLILALTHNHPGQHLQSLIVGSVVLVASFISFMLGIIADLICINRLLIEDTLELAKTERFDTKR
ncbi:MAG TPA: glycosyltransferase family 2 protein [Candidatus Saccharimonadales bacterium]|nr:glycosyltransferase family 2 protein [Candidatus Saccharimonadales bacterium]